MHHGGADGQFPRDASDDAGSDRPSDALDARRQLFDPGTQPPRGIESSPGQLPGQSCDAWEALVVDDHSESVDLQELVEAFGDARLRYFGSPPANAV